MRVWSLSIILAVMAVQRPLVSQAIEPSALWKGIRATLLRLEGREYFEMTIKDAIMPPLVGTVVSSKPKAHPSEFLISMDDNKTPDVKLRLNTRLEKPFRPGTLVSFVGVGREFTMEPFMVTFDAVSINRVASRETSNQPPVEVSW